MHNTEDTELLIALATTLPRQIEMTYELHLLASGWNDFVAIWTRFGGVAANMLPEPDQTLRQFADAYACPPELVIAANVNVTLPNGTRFAVPGPDPMPAWLTIAIGLLGSAIGWGIVIGVEGRHTKDTGWVGIASFLHVDPAKRVQAFGKGPCECLWHMLHDNNAREIGR